MEHSKESEAIYVAHEDSHIVMSEKVQALAGSIYQEFERMINKYDEEVVKDLMPLVVNVLECLDLSYTENQEHEVEVELLREDNEQLVTQYEREKQLRKTSEQKFMEIEDQSEEEIKELSSKIESLEAILRMLELKSKNAADHVSRLEDKETESKREYAKLHERYTELFKTHMDYMERTKILMGTDRLENFGMPPMKKLNSIMTRSAGPVSFGFESLANNSSMLKSLASPSPGDGAPTMSIMSPVNTNALQEELTMDDVADSSISSQEQQNVQNGAAKTNKSYASAANQTQNQNQQGKSHTRKEERTGNTLYQEFSFQDAEMAEEPPEITGSWVHPGEYASSDVSSENSCDSPTTHSSVNVNDNFFGMGKEVENLIMENNELLATKNALNIVKDDLIAKVDELTSEQEILREEIASLQAVKNRLKLRIQELEDEVKKTKEELEKKTNNKSDDEEDVPLAQRKRFTRVEMARVLMERNQYKERFMELQDAVRWTEMLRAAKQDPSLEKRNNRGILNFFSNLFSKSTPPPAGLTTDRLVSGGGIVPHGSPTKIPAGPVATTQGLESMRPSRADMSAEKLQLRRLGDPQQRRDQTTYKQIKAHVRKDDGRMQAYGWSLPAKSTAGPQPGGKDGSSKSSGAVAVHPPSAAVHGKHLPVPVPIYCRPFMEQTPGMKIFCSSGVDLTGGRSKQRESCRNYTSPHVWICTATHSASRVTIIDANRPADMLLTFDVCSSHLLCIACVPGAKEDDLKGDDGVSLTACEAKENDGGDKFGQLSFTVSASEGSVEKGKEESIISSRRSSSGSSTSSRKTDFPKTETCEASNSTRLEEERSEGDGESSSEKDTVTATSTPATSNTGTSKEDKDSTYSSLQNSLEQPSTASPSSTCSSSTHNAAATVARVVETKMSSVLPTMWLGAQTGFVYVHSAVAQWDRCLHKVRLPDSVLSIAHLRGRTFVSMANGTVAIFRRGVDGQWDLSGYYLLDLCQQPHHSIRCLSVVHQDVWCGFRNKIHVLDVSTLLVKTTFEAHPRKESQVRQMAWCGDGVWVSIRLDSTLRLYHAETHEHLQDVDIEPYVSKMLGTGKLGFSYARITALLVACHRLWIGTGNGVIISVPLSESMTFSNPVSMGSKGPGCIVRVGGGDDEPGKEIPYCSMSQAQLSFHGHRDAVKFFVAVPGSSSAINLAGDPEKEDASALQKSNSMLVISGGEGYIDFRVGDGEEMDDGLKSPPDPSHRTEKAHIIIWQVNSAPNPA